MDADAEMYARMRAGQETARRGLERAAIYDEWVVRSVGWSDMYWQRDDGLCEIYPTYNVHTHRPCIYMHPCRQELSDDARTFTYYEPRVARGMFVTWASDPLV